MPRQRNKRGVSVAITQSTDGRWHGFVSVGGKYRRHRTGATYEECAERVRKLEEQLASNFIPPVGRQSTVEKYLTEWLAGRRGDLRYATVKSYQTAVECYLIPNLRGVRLDALRAEHIRKTLQVVGAEVSAQAAHKAHRVLRSALSDAVRGQVLPTNPAKLVRAPKVNEDEITPLSVEEVQSIFSVVAGRRNAARWMIALALGHRQGEVLGLHWHRPDRPRLPSDIDLEAGTLTVREKLLRKTWQHGCDDPKTCAKRAGDCPQRHSGGLVFEPPKSRASERTVALPEPVWAALLEHRETQLDERAQAGSKWREHGLVFTTPFGEPIDPARDWSEWKSILTEAGVADARLHDARHTAATFLLMQDVTGRTAMGLMGWSQESLVRRYQHPVEKLKRDAAQRVGDLLWPGSATKVLPEQPAKILRFRRRGA